MKQAILDLRTDQAIKVQLVANDKGYDDYDVTGSDRATRVCIVHGIRKGELFNVYNQGSKTGGIWKGNLVLTLRDLLGANQISVDTDLPTPATLLYTFPNIKPFNEWLRCETKDFVPTPRQSLVIEAVRLAKSTGLYYSSEIRDFVARHLQVKEGDLNANFQMRVEGGVFGMDCYYAAKYLDAQQCLARETEAKSLLKPYVGQKLGTMVFNDFKRCTGVAVVEAGEQIRISFKRGSNSIIAEAAYESIRHGMDRAFEKGLRKDDFNTFVARTNAGHQLAA